MFKLYVNISEELISQYHLLYFIFASFPIINNGIIQNMMNTNDSSFFFSKIKIIFLGDPTVGKTSIISAIRLNQFNDRQQATVGIDFFAQIVTKNNRSYKLQFWDTAGQQRFRSIIPSYVRNANIGIIVFDVKNRSSYDSVSNWLESFRQNSAQGSKVLVIGNKVDLESRTVSKQEAELRFEKEKATYIQISAKTKYQISKLTQFLIGCIECEESEMMQQQLRTKSYTKLQNLVQELPGAIVKPGRCCVI